MSDPMDAFNGLKPNLAMQWVEQYADTCWDTASRRHIRANLEEWLQAFALFKARYPDHVGPWAEDVPAVEAALRRMYEADKRGPL